MTAPPRSLTSGRLLARNTLWNLLGQAAPLAVAILAIPWLVRGLGVDRFGLLSLVWILVGYFSLFDLGMGRALTKLVADKLGTDDEHALPALVWTSLAAMLALSLAGTLVLVAVTPLLVDGILEVPVPLRAETRLAFYCVGASIPLVVSNAALRGVLEAQQRFAVLSAIRIPLGVFNFLGPLLVLPFSRSLVPIVVVLVAGRVLGWIAHFVACRRCTPWFSRVVLRRDAVAPVLRLGTWITVSNVTVPVLVYLDRFLIGALVSVGAVAYYATPFEVVTKLFIIPAAVGGVLFPAFAATVRPDPARATLLFGRGVKYVFLAVFPVVLVVVAFADEGLRAWLGPDFAAQSAPVLRWLAAGVFVNCLAQIAFTLVQGAGRPDITATLHVIELPLYAAAAWWMIRAYGIEGAAIAWTARVTVDGLCLFVAARRCLGASPRVLADVGIAAAAGCTLLLLGTMPGSVLGRASFVTVALTGCGLLAWFCWLAPDERASVFAPLAGITK